SIPHWLCRGHRPYAGQIVSLHRCPPGSAPVVPTVLRPYLHPQLSSQIFYHQRRRPVAFWTWNPFAFYRAVILTLEPAGHLNAFVSAESVRVLRSITEKWLCK